MSRYTERSPGIILMKSNPEMSSVTFNALYPQLSPHPPPLPPLPSLPHKAVIKSHLLSALETFSFLRTRDVGKAWSAKRRKIREGEREEGKERSFPLSLLLCFSFLSSSPLELLFAFRGRLERNRHS